MTQKHTAGMIGNVGIECISACVAFANGRYSPASIASKQLDALKEQHAAIATALEGINPEAVPEVVKALENLLPVCGHALRLANAHGAAYDVAEELREAQDALSKARG